MPTPVPLVIVAAVDPVLRDTAAASLLCDLPGSVGVAHEWRPDREELRRTVTGIAELVSDEVIDLEHPCLSCATREDLVPTVTRLVAEHRPTALVVSLPVTADPQPAVHALSQAVGVRVAACLTVLDSAGLEQDLLGVDLLADRGLALAPNDRRALGEALARQIDCADVIATVGPDGPRTQALLDHLIEPERERFGLELLDAWTLVRGVSRARSRGNLYRVRPTGAADRDGVWTLDLRTQLPLHPERLLDDLERLGSGPVRGRGHFWLGSRPRTACAWDGSGGQLSVGELGSWHSAAPRTRLVISGTDRDPGDLQRAFHAATMTVTELARGSATDDDTEDGWDDWLGPRRLDTKGSGI